MGIPIAQLAAGGGIKGASDSGSQLQRSVHASNYNFGGNDAVFWDSAVGLQSSVIKASGIAGIGVEDDNSRIMLMTGGIAVGIVLLVLLVRRGHGA